MRLVFLLALPLFACAQLIPTGSPIPKGPNTPVVFLDGYQFGCTGGPSTFASNFAEADQVLQAANIPSVFFDNCTVSSAQEPSIEALGIAFGNFLAGLKYSDGSAVTQVDVVAHSMGGLIVRSFLAGKQVGSPAVFNPPATVPIRKAIFLATPHFGTAVANDLGNDTQTHEMSVGSQFLFDLSTWNNNNDDLRGVDALAIIGNGGTGVESGKAGFDDGVVTLTSGSIAFARPGRTRIVPYCHTTDPLLVAFGVCSSSTPAINDIGDPKGNNTLVGPMIVSFLTGTTLWQNLGEAIESDPIGSTTSGVYIEAEDLNGNEQSIGSAVAGASTKLSVNAVAYAEAIPSSTNSLQVTPTGGSALTQSVSLRAGSGNSIFIKPGPSVGAAVTAGSAIFPYDVAADGYVAVYGSNLTTVTQPQSAPVPYPPQIADVQALVNGTPAQVQFISPNQLNIVYPEIAPGPTQLTIVSSAGKQTLTVFVAPAVPSIFTGANGSAAARIGNVTGEPVVGPASPLHFGDTVEIYMTGLGQTSLQANGLYYAQIQPTVSVGGQNCIVTYAGLVPGFTGFDQVNCQIPTGATGTAVPLIITSNGWVSNTATLNIQ